MVLKAQPSRLGNSGTAVQGPGLLHKPPLALQGSPRPNAPQPLCHLQSAKLHADLGYPPPQARHSRGAKWQAQLQRRPPPEPQISSPPPPRLPPSTGPAPRLGPVHQLSPESRGLSTVLPSGLHDTPAQARPAPSLMWHTRCLHIHSLPPRQGQGLLLLRLCSSP